MDVRFLFISLFLFLGEGPLSETPDFPNQILLTKNNLVYILDKTGSVEKNELYSIAHYLQGAIEEQEKVIFVHIFTDGEVKEFLIEWKKNFTSQELQEEFATSFEKALNHSEYQDNLSTIETFLHFFDHDVKSGEQTKIFWMANGDLQVFYGSTLKGKIKSIPFAKAVWKIWLGKNSVVQKTLLIDSYIRTTDTID